VFSDVYGGWRVLQWSSVLVAGCVVVEKIALWLSIYFVAIVVVVTNKV
jgi:hypothetical protein